MKKILMSVALVAGAATAAQAADLPRKAPILKAPIVQVYDWTGFYIGVNAGGSVGRDRTSLTTAVAGAPQSREQSYLSPIGAIGGGQIGYNWQFRNFYNLVLGVEADIQASGQRDNSTCLLACNVTQSASLLNQKIDWFGTARVRAGIATGPVLSYITGGYAYGQTKTTDTLTLFTGAGAAGTTTSILTNNFTKGGYVIGSGVEAQLGGNWTAKIEYLYVNLGSSTSSLVIPSPLFGAGTASQRTEIRDNIFRAGLNYRIGGNAAYTEPVGNWAGVYVGGNFGSIVARDRSTLTVPAAAAGVAGGITQSFNLVPDGFIGGGQIGYNWQAAAWVFGVEGDFQGSTARDNKACVAFCAPPTVASNVALNQTLPWLATARGRLGYSVGSTLFYGTAGYAYGETRTRFTEVFGPLTGTAEIKRSKGGYVAGAGIESPLTNIFGFFGPNWTSKTEYLFVDLGRTRNTFTAGTFAQTFTTRTEEHIFRTGINYHFNTPVAVVAKY